ncbi:btb/poz domain-containing protein [Quercus suber]|uniref:Btb/poz domain-containing protein n=1 Tax=Quercus suber TaxID=58331 RepID=A0AAW0JT77_QUESU
MACMKLGSKTDAFQRQGQAWFCTTGLPSDIVVEVGEMSFHLHKFPLLSRSGIMEKLIAEASEDVEEGCTINLPEIPGGAKTFELVAKFCYGVKLELTSSNVVYLRCAAEHLEMTEEYGEGNLITLTEVFLSQVVLRSWKDSVKALQTCDDVLPYAEELNITKRCIESLASKACTDPNLFGWPVMEHSGPMQSPGGSVLWNGISTGARPKNTSSDWWHDDVSALSLPLYKRLISVMETRGIKQEIIAGSLTCYAKKYLPGLIRRQGASESSNRLAPVALGAPPSEEDQKLFLEEIDRLLPMQKGLVPTKFLFGLLRTALILRSHPWLAESEREQLCRLMDCQKLSLEACTHAAQNERLPLRIVVQVLFFEQLQLRTSIAGCFLVSDNLDGSRQLRSGIAGSNEGGGWATAVRENQVLKVGMDNMRMRVSELEKECSSMRQEIEKLGRVKGSSSTWGNVSKKFGFKLKSQMCSAQAESVSNQNNGNGVGKVEKLKDMHGKHKKKSSHIE